MGGQVFALQGIPKALSALHRLPQREGPRQPMGTSPRAACAGALQQRPALRPASPPPLQPSAATALRIAHQLPRNQEKKQQRGLSGERGSRALGAGPAMGLSPSRCQSRCRLRTGTGASISLRA